MKDEEAVSARTAKEMAQGAISSTGGDISVSVTGLAGPDGGTKEKPVGLVYIGCSCKDKTEVREFHFNGNRNKDLGTGCCAGADLAERLYLKKLLLSCKV